MATEREKREAQELAYYENQYAQAMLDAGKLDEYKNYLKTIQHRLKCGMTADEIDAVQKRAKEAAQV
ncbi:MAG: hypothetical protein FWB91_05775 [Defluviitaleaceae bacterium]|nr:hypothetical protein [Defluviitaleaceae bacterium]